MNSDLLANPDEWENPALSCYLGARAASVEALGKAHARSAADVEGCR